MFGYSINVILIKLCCPECKFHSIFGSHMSYRHTDCMANHGQALLLDSYVVKKFLRSVQHEAGTWDPNYTQGVDFLDHDFL